MTDENGFFAIGDVDPDNTETVKVKQIELENGDSLAPPDKPKMFQAGAGRIFSTVNSFTVPRGQASFGMGAKEPLEWFVRTYPNSPWLPMVEKKLKDSK